MPVFLCAKDNAIHFNFNTSLPTFHCPHQTTTKQEKLKSHELKHSQLLNKHINRTELLLSSIQKCQLHPWVENGWRANTKKRREGAAVWLELVLGEVKSRSVSMGVFSPSHQRALITSVDCPPPSPLSGVHPWLDISPSPPHSFRCLHRLQSLCFSVGSMCRINPLCLEHELHTRKPHFRQWCRRCVLENLLKQRMHLSETLSGSQVTA